MIFKDIELKYNIRTLMTFEQLGGGARGGLTDLALLLYAAYYSGGGELSFDEVLDEVDGDPSILSEVSNWAKEESEKNGYFAKEKDAKKKD